MARGSRNRARSFGGGGGGGILSAYLGALGGQVVPEDTSQELAGQEIKEGVTKTAQANQQKATIKWKPKSGFMNFLSGGQGTKTANELNTQQVLDSIKREQDFIDMQRTDEFKTPRDILAREGIVPDNDSIIKFKEATTQPRISASREKSLLEGEEAANKRGETELAARKRHMTSDASIEEATFEAARKRDLAKAGLEQTPTDIANIKARKEAEPFFLNTERNKAALMPVGEGTSFYDANLGKIVSKSPKSSSPLKQMQDQVIQEAMGVKPKGSNPAFQEKLEFDIIMVDGKPVKVPRRKAQPPASEVQYKRNF